MLFNLRKPSKLIIPSLLVALFIISISQPALGQTATIEVDPSTVTVTVCKNFFVNIWIRNLPREMNRFIFTVRWDDTQMKLIAKHPLPIREYRWIPVFLTNDSSSLTFVASGPPILVNAHWIELTFQCINAGSSSINLEGTKIYYDLGREMDHTTVSSVITQRARIAQTVDISNRIREDFLPSEDIYATGSGFTPGVPVNIHIVNDRAWTLGDTIPPDISSDGINSIITDASGNIGKTLVWPQPTEIGEYDIVFDVNPNGQYECAHYAGDFVDDPNHPGFTVLSLDPGSSVVGGFYTPVNNLAVISPILALTSLVCIVFTILVIRKKRKF